MQDPRMPLPEEVPSVKTQKKKVSSQRASISQLQGNRVKGIQEAPKAAHKASKRSSKNEISHQPERSNSDSLPESSSASGNEYRTLRRKYLLLEEESFALGSELREVEDEVKTLEDEKLALLDQLVVLEGLVDPSELQSQGAKIDQLKSSS